MPRRGDAQPGLREVRAPRADAGLCDALRSAYAVPADLPAEFAGLLDQLR